MASASLIVETDWPSKGDYASLGWRIVATPTNDDDFIVGGLLGNGIGAGLENIVYLVQDYSITRGRTSELERVGVGTATITVDSPSALFSPLNTSGCLSGSLLPNRRINIGWKFGSPASTFYRFVGKLKEINSEPDTGGGRNAVLVCTDDWNELQRVETRSTLYQNVQSGSLAGSLLDNAGYFTTCRNIADGADNYRYAYFERRKLDEVLVDIERTEYGFIYINGAGAFVFHDRNYRSVTSTVSASFDNTMAGISYRRSDDDIATVAEVPYVPKVQKAETTVWTLQPQGALDIPAQSSGSFFGNYLDPGTCQLAPALGVASGTANFFTASDGTGTNVGADFSTSFVAFAESFKFVASNSGSSTEWLTGFTVTGSPLVSYEQQTATARDVTACALYGERTLTYGGQNLIHLSGKARDLAQYLVNRYKDPQNLDDVTLNIVNDNATNWEQILRRDLDDRLAISNSSLGLNGQDFFIGKLDEQWSVGGVHSVTYTLERASTQNVFVIDLSEIGGTDGLGY